MVRLSVVLESHIAGMESKVKKNPLYHSVVGFLYLLSVRTAV